MHAKRLAVTCFLLGIVSLVSGCVIAPREGYYDHEHHRYWHDHQWHECGDHEERCR